MRLPFVPWLAGLLVVACSPTPETTAPSAPPAPADVADAEPAPEPDAPAATEEPAPMPEAQRAVLDKINDRYETETDAGAWGDRFEKEGREVHDRQADIIAELGIKPGWAVADVGAGTGLYTLPFAEAVGDSGRVFAVDIQSYFLDHIQQRATKAGHKHVTTVKATARSAELPPGELDLVFMCDAYHHVEQPAAYLESLHAALRDGGRLVIIDYKRGEEGTWRYGHIRAEPHEFAAEIEAAGFVLDREVEVLKDNFFFVFRAV